MAKHRLKCRNGQCKFEGLMEATSDRPFAKKAILMQSSSKKPPAAGAVAPVSQMQIRCPKCGGRWRMRADQLH
jgi:hypothetical protein